MARITVRYLTIRPGKGDELPRYFWQPSGKLRAQGWGLQRIPLNWAEFSDPQQLENAAVARAQELNEELDTTRAAAGLSLTRPAAPVSTRTLGDLIKLYQASGNFTKLAASTQRGYRQSMLKLEDWAADVPVRAIDTVRIQRLKAGLAATPSFANAVVRVLRLLLAFGRHQGWLVNNPAERPGLVATDPAGLIWPRAAVEQFVATADGMKLFAMGTAVLLNEWLGQRQGDIIRMPRAALRLGGGTLIVRQSKGGRKKAGVSLPLGMVKPLADRLAAELARHAERDARPGAIPAVTIVVSEATGKAYKLDNFRHVFARVRAKMAATTPWFEVDYLMPGRDMADPDAFRIYTEDLTFMHLRHTAVTRLAEAGCDTPLISSVSGHAQASVQQIMERYMVRTAQMARVAFQRRIDAEAPPPATDAATVGGGGK